MGSMMVARCACGYESGTLLIGGGMLDFHEVCYWPAWCESCFEVVAVNAMPTSPACGRCGSPVVLYGQVQRDIDRFDWCTPDGRCFAMGDGPVHPCRICATDRLEFEHVGTFD
jgi:hypothetical protein